MENIKTNLAPKSKYPYKPPVSGEIAIIASNIRTLDDNGYIIKETFRQLLECNFNTAVLHGNIDDSSKKDTLTTYLGYAKNEDPIINILANCYFFDLGGKNPENGIKQAEAFVEFFKNEHTYTDKKGDVVSNNASVIKGWVLKDEPTQDQLSQTEYGYNLKSIYDYILGNDPQQRPVQINLVGWFNHSYENERENYKTYLDTFQTNFNSNLWSYDLYPITQTSCLINTSCNLADNCKVNVYYKEFYWDLNTYHERSKATGGVFWAHVQSAEFINGSKLHPAVLESYIRFEAFSALAFGAQGIVYWTYRQQPNQPKEKYSSALIDRNFNKTPAWYFAKRVNHEIKQYSKVFVNSELKKWTHVGEGYGQPVINQRIGALDGITASGIGALITQLRTNGKNYLVIVSHDVEEYQTVDMTFAYAGVIELTPTTSSGNHCREKVLSTTSIRRLLIPGGYLIYEFKDAYA